MRWLGRTCRTVQDRLWAADEHYARDRGYRSQRSRSGWTITVRDPRWDLRQECAVCHGSGSDLAANPCAACGGVGVITLEAGEAGERR